MRGDLSCLGDGLELEAGMFRRMGGRIPWWNREFKRPIQRGDELIPQGEQTTKSRKSKMMQSIPSYLSAVRCKYD